jgi:hypothetical protein
MDKSKELSLLRQFFIAAIVIGTFAGGTAAFNYVFRDGLPPFPRLWSPQTSEIILTTIGVLIIGAMLAGFAVSAF